MDAIADEQPARRQRTLACAPSRATDPAMNRSPPTIRRCCAARCPAPPLVEGNTRISTAIKYLTQSTWSHAALFIGDAPTGNSHGSDAPIFIEADLVKGVWAAPLSHYDRFHVRICRPVGLTREDARHIVEAATARIGQTYDLKNIIDLCRYLLPTPPVPVRWRRRTPALRSGRN